MCAHQPGAVRVVHSALERTRALREEIARVAAKEFAYALPGQVLDTLEALAVVALEKIQALLTSERFSSPHTPPAERLDEIRTHATELEWIHDRLAMLHGVDSSRLPFEMVGAFEGLTAELLDGDSSIKWLVKPSHDYNYCVDSLAELLGVDDVDQDYLTCFLVSFPSAEAHSVLTHTILLHEVAHPFFVRSLKSDLVEALRERIGQAEGTLESKIAAHVDAVLRERGFSPREKDSRQADLYTNQQEVVRGELLSRGDEVALAWLEEIACDLTAVRLAGPAYICAFESLALPFFPRGDVRDTHPDDALRLRFLSDFMAWSRSRSEPFSDLCDEFGTHSEVSDEVTPSQSERDQLPHELAYEVMTPTEENELAQRLFELVWDRTPPTLELPAFLPALRTAVSQLVELIPPDPFLYLDEKNLRSSDVVVFVFCACWLFKLRHVDQWKARYQWSEGECDARLNHVGLKALEAGNLRRQYNEANGDT